jgi:hypothetical protein
LATYGFVLLLAAFVWIGVKVASPLEFGAGFFTVFAFAVAPFFLMLFLRRRGRRGVVVTEEAIRATIRSLEPNRPVFRYRAKDGRICGPDTRERLLVLQRMGAIDGDTPVAAYEEPEDWHPLSSHPAFLHPAG